MKRIVIDASVLAKLFAPTDERHTDQAQAVLDDWEQGRTSFVAPELLALELLNVASRKWQLPAAALGELARAIRDLDIETQPVDLQGVVAWTTLGLTAYDAAYVTLAAQERIPLVTDDDQLISIAMPHARALADY